jgi:hypothetical protein
MGVGLVDRFQFLDLGDLFPELPARHAVEAEGAQLVAILTGQEELAVPDHRRRMAMRDFRFPEQVAGGAKMGRGLFLFGYAVCRGSAKAGPIGRRQGGAAGQPQKTTENRALKIFPPPDGKHNTNPGPCFLDAQQRNIVCGLDLLGRTGEKGCP